MGTFVAAGRTGELQDGQMKKAQVGGNEILLARVGDSYFAVSNLCPHFGGHLNEGRLDGSIVTCPRHGSQFDIKDGRVVRWLKGGGLLSAIGKTLKSPRPLEAYKTKVEGDNILIEL